MGSKLSGTQVVKLDTLDEGKRKWDRVRKLVELAAVTPKSQDDLARQCSRTANEVGRSMSNAGFGALATNALDLASVTKRPGSFQSKLGAIRDLVAQGNASFDRARKAVVQS